jgi:hypothetical protein
VKFFIDASLPPRIVDAFRAEGHDAVHADDLGLGSASDPEIATAAQAFEECIVTRDFDFADLRNYVPARHRGIVILTIPLHRGSTYIAYLIGKLFEYLRAGGTVDRKLLIVEADRIRVRE